VRYAQEQDKKSIFSKMASILRLSGLVRNHPGASYGSGGHCQDPTPGQTSLKWRDRGASMTRGKKHKMRRLSTTWHKSTERFEVIRQGLLAAKLDGLFLEFGVSGGTSINLIAKSVTKTVHGFDHFFGLPEDWRDGIKKGAWSTGGKIPQVESNVVLHPGLFEETLPAFVEAHRGPVAFMHVDCDLYSSTRTVFHYLGDLVTSGTVIVLDEYCNFPGWQEHEYKAFQEFVAEKALRYEYVARSGEEGFSVAVKIL
jgi:hypothetical protein